MNVFVTGDQSGRYPTVPIVSEEDPSGADEKSMACWVASGSILLPLFMERQKSHAIVTKSIVWLLRLVAIIDSLIK